MNTCRIIAVCHTCGHQHPLKTETAVREWFDWQYKHNGHSIALIDGVTQHPQGMLQRAIDWLFRKYGYGWVQYAHNATVKMTYAASSNLTVTNLNSLAASATFVAGWESDATDNTSNLYLDYRLTAKLTSHASNRQAGQVYMYCVGRLDDSTWPDVFDGTESAETPTDTEERDAICRFAAATDADTTASEVYYLDCPSVARVFDFNMPSAFVVYITGNIATSTNAQFASSGNQVTVKGSYLTVA